MTDNATNGYKWSMEVLKDTSGRKFKIALFDFDGTISLIREGWQDIMIPYFCEEIEKTPGAENESAEEIKALVTDFVDALTGKQTIYQCMQLKEEVEKRGGTAQDAMEYKNEYLRRLMEKIDFRRRGLADGSIKRDEMLVRGAYQFIEKLRAEGIKVYLASGTDEPQVREEAKLLGVFDLFDGNVYGARDEHASQCTKELVIRRILSENDIKSEDILSFGDGFVEIELIADIGGYPIGVATDEKRKYGINEWKRDRLISAGAEAIIPDFEDYEALMSFIRG